MSDPRPSAERSQLRLAVGLAVIAVGLAVAWASLAGRDRYLASAGDEVVWDLLARDVTAVDLHDGRIARGAEGWEAPGSPSDRLDDEAVRRLLDALEEARRGLRVDADAALAGATVPLTAWRGDRADTIFVGGAAPVGDRTYVVVPGGRVVAVRGGLGELAHAGLAGLVVDGR